MIRFFRTFVLVVVHVQWILPVSAQAPQGLDPAWTYHLLGGNVARYSLHQIDLENDGRSEIVVEDENRISVVGWPEGSTEPYVLYQSFSLGPPISDTAVWSDGEMWFVAAILDDGYADGSVVVLELPTFEMVNSCTVPAHTTRIEAADVISGGPTELIISGWDTTEVYESTTLDQLATLPAPGSGVVTGDVDGDPAIEIVFSTGSVFEIRDGSPVLEWTVPFPGTKVLLADLDGSPPLEIVVSDRSTVIAFEFGNPIELWAYSYDYLVPLGSADLTRDGREEVLVAISYDEVIGLHPLLGVPIWLENYGDVFCRPSVYWPIDMAGDLDGDGDEELIWPVGNPGSRYLCIADAWSGDLLWRSDCQAGPVRATASGDLEGDGTVERLAVFSDLLLTVFGRDEPTPRSWVRPYYPFAGNGDEIAAVAVGDVDRDGAAEIVVAIEGYFPTGGAIHELDGVTLEHERGSIYGFNEVSAIDIADLDGDNWPEIAFAGADYDDNLVIGAVEGATTELEWSVTVANLGGTVQALMVGEVDGDPGQEIVVVAGDSRSFGPSSVVITDVDTLDMRWTPTQEFFGLDLVDLDGDEILEILVGSDAGEIVALTGVEPIAELWRIPVSPTRLVGIRSFEDHTGRLRAAVSTDDALLGVDLTSGEVIWTTPILGEQVGRLDSLERVPLTGESAPGFLVGAYHSLYEIRPSDFVVFADGFESGSTENWEGRVP